MASKKKDLKSSLLSSLQKEEKKVEDKFTKAESHFDNKKAPEAPVKLAKKTEKTVRDAFTFPPGDHALFYEIQKKGMKAGVMANKSEIVRAGLHLLNKLSASELESTLKAIDKLKVGRR